MPCRSPAVQQLDGGAVLIRAARAALGVDDHPTGVQNDLGRSDGIGCDGHILQDRDFVQLGFQPVGSGIDGHRHLAIFGGHALAQRPVAGDLIERKGRAFLDRHRHARREKGKRGKVVFWCCGGWGGFRHWRRFWLRHRHRRLQRIRQGRGIFRFDVLPARILGQTGHGLAFLGGQAKAHNMGGEIHARCLQFISQSAGVGIAGFDPVGDQDDGGLLFGVAQLGGGLTDSL